MRIDGLWISLISTLYGFFAGIIGTGNSVKAALLNHNNVVKGKFIGIMAITALITNIIKMTIYSKSLLISGDDVPFLLVLIIIGFIGSYIGKKFVKNISSTVFRKIILYILFIMGLKLSFFP